MPPKAWKTLESRPVYANPWIRVREDVAELPNGRTTLYGVVTMGECVGVLPFVDNDTVLLVRQYRYIQAEDFRWEMPTGGMHQGESPVEAVQRELAEEAGYQAERLLHISTFYTSKSVCDETAHLFLAFDMRPNALPPDETEFLELAAFPFDVVLNMVLADDIRDAMTIIAVLHAARLRASGAWPPRS